MRGEDDLQIPAKLVPVETPPRAWGRPLHGQHTELVLGNTPTCVGKTSSRFPARPCNKKHPHVRGEDSSHRSVNVSDQETPPRAWGRLTMICINDARLGNTPTCVGKTGSQPEWAPVVQKHPHVRGEDFNDLDKGVELAETPPRAWGRQHPAHGRVRRVRNTPTCVGKTTSSANVTYATEKHPHVRGEDRN